MRHHSMKIDLRFVLLEGWGHKAVTHVQQAADGQQTAGLPHQYRGAEEYNIEHTQQLFSERRSHVNGTKVLENMA